MNNLLKYINIVTLLKMLVKCKGALVWNETDFKRFKQKGKLYFAIKNV